MEGGTKEKETGWSQGYGKGGRSGFAYFEHNLDSAINCLRKTWGDRPAAAVY
jgi:hypothetical protein